MASKIDKDALKKNLFWILLGVFVLFWFVGVVIAVLPGDDTAAKSYEKSKKGIDDAKKNGVKTAAYQKPWEKHGEKFRTHKDVIWAKAWKQQESMYTWPEAMMPPAVRPWYPDVPFARDATGKKNITEDMRIRSTFRTLYREQFVDLEDLVSPAQFNGGREAVFPEQKWDGTNPPTQEEIWLAQEDYWVRRELLVVIKRAMDAIALFQEIPPAKDDKLPEGIVAKRVFRNANWELTLLIEPVGRGFVISELSTIKNVNIDERTQVLANSRGTKGLAFRFQQGPVAYRDIYISGEPLPFGKEAPITKTKVSVAPIDINDPKKPFYIEQLLDWEISPVRRVDLLALARHSHRTIIGGLKPNPELKALDAVATPEKAADDTTTTAQGGMSGPAGMSGGMQMGGPGGMSGPGATGANAAAADVTTINKMPRERYLHVTPQCRHLPIVVRLVVDQAHIHDILSSFSNSQLRMQITQVSFHHVRDVTRATEAPGTGAPTTPGGPTGPDPTGPGGPGGPGGSKIPGEMRPPNMGGSSPPGGGMMIPQMPGMYGGGNMGSGGGGRFVYGRQSEGDGAPPRPTGAAGISTARVIDNARLVELSIYALASIYERFPARPKDTTTPTTPTVPGKN